MTDFEKECNGYSIDDLELIIETQKELYTDEEMKCLINVLECKKQDIETEKNKSIPTEMKCPKCDVILPIETQKCPYCEFEFGNKNYKYAIIKDNINTDNIGDCDSCNDEISDYGNKDYNYNDETSESNEKENNFVTYILSFIVPIVGFILGAILMSKDNENDKLKGITCVIIGIISIIVSSIIAVICLNI